MGLKQLSQKGPEDFFLLQTFLLSFHYIIFVDVKTYNFNNLEFVI
jgi:hypothetical protein